MRRLLSLPSVLALLVVVLGVVGPARWLAGPAAAPVTRVVEVVMKGNRFAPDVIQARPGDRITFRNADRHLHSVTLVDHEDIVEEEFIDPGTSFTLVLPNDMAPGAYDLACTIHVEMRGKLVVSAS